MVGDARLDRGGNDILHRIIEIHEGIRVLDNQTQGGELRQTVLEAQILPESEPVETLETLDQYLEVPPDRPARAQSKSDRNGGGHLHVSKDGIRPQGRPGAFFDVPPGAVKDARDPVKKLVPVVVG